MKIIAEEAQPVTSLRKSVPPNVADAVGKALERLPADRFSSAAEFSQALKDPRFTVGAGSAGARVGSAVLAGRWWRDWRPWALAGGLVATGIMVGRFASQAPPPAPVEARFRVPVDPTRRVTPAPANTLALSPDGRIVVYVGRAGGGAGYQLYERRMEELDAFRPIPGTESGGWPAFSPDGTRLAFLGPGGARYVSVPFTGAPPTTVTSNIASQTAVIWLDDRSLVATDNAGRLVRVGLDGRVTPIASPDTVAGERFLFAQAALPDGRTVLATASTGTSTNGPVIAFDARTGARTTVIETEVDGVWYAHGSLLWHLASGALQAGLFDARHRRVAGQTVTLAEGVRQAIGGSGQIAVSDAGSLVYLPAQPLSLTLLDRAGHREVVALGKRFHSPRFSPDGGRLALDFLQQGSRDVWTFDLRQRTLSRLSFENDGHDPAWSRDGRWVYYVHNAGIWRRRADGGGGADSVYRGSYAQALELAPGGAIIAAANGSNGSFDLELLSAATPPVATPLLATRYVEEAGTLSPNGRWLAYTSDETGRAEIYVQPFPAGGAKVLVSRGGGTEARWSPDGRTLYYLGERDGNPYLIAAAVTAGSEFNVTSRTPLFDVTDFEPAEPHANWDVSPDGTRFVMVDQGALTEMVFILNWPVELRLRASGGAR
jgi:serine/threonine-protein kinase